MTPEQQFSHNESTSFEAALQGALHARSEAAVPSGLEQRLLARLAQVAEAAAAPSCTLQRPLFASIEIGKAQRSARSVWSAIGAHVFAIALLAFVVAAQTRMPLIQPAHKVSSIVLPPSLPPPPAPKLEKMGGGGGQHDGSAASQGRLPKFASQQILAPTAPPILPPKLAVEPTVVVPAMKIADNNMVNLGLPNSSLKGVSLGNGSGTGVGSGAGAGVGPGSGTGMGGSVLHPGGSVHAPTLIYAPDAEFSEEARKAKFYGNVEVYLWVDEYGNPSHIKIARGVGMGLDEKAMEAVRQYKFKPAMQNGRPVRVDMYVEVNFTIF